MTDRALSEAAMLTSLRDIRLPADAAGGVPADLAMIAGLAGLAALLVAGLVRLLGQRRRVETLPTLADRIAGLQTLEEPHRRVALLHLLRDHAPDRYAELARALYVPDAGLQNATLEAEVARLV